MVSIISRKEELRELMTANKSSHSHSHHHLCEDGSKYSTKSEITRQHRLIFLALLKNVLIPHYRHRSVGWRLLSGGRGQQSRAREAERGFDRQPAEQLGACAKVRVEVILIKLIPPQKPQNDVIHCLLISDSCENANTNSQSVVNANMSSFFLSTLFSQDTFKDVPYGTQGGRLPASVEPPETRELHLSYSWLA